MMTIAVRKDSIVELDPDGQSILYLVVAAFRSNQTVGFEAFTTNVTGSFVIWVMTSYRTVKCN
jgi:hypothetical protein